MTTWPAARWWNLAFGLAVLAPLSAGLLLLGTIFLPVPAAEADPTSGRVSSSLTDTSLPGWPLELGYALFALLALAAGVRAWSGDQVAWRRVACLLGLLAALLPAPLSLFGLI